MIHGRERAPEGGAAELRGLIRNAETRKGLGGYVVIANRVRSKKRGSLGRATSLANGEFRIRYDAAVSGSKGPSVVLTVLNRVGKVVHTSERLERRDRFRPLRIDVRVREEDLRPPGAPVHDPFDVLARHYAAEISVLQREGIKDRATLFAVDLAPIARRTETDLAQLEAFRLNAEMTHVEGFPPEGALALVHAGIKTRQEVSATAPWALADAIQRARESDLIDLDDWPTPSEIYGWSGYALGVTPEPYASEVSIGTVRQAQRLLRRARNGGTHVYELANMVGLLNPWSRYTALAEVRGLMLDAGVHDLSSLGTFRVEGNRMIGPGYHIAQPEPSPATSLTEVSQADVLVQRAGARSDVKAIEVSPDGLHLRMNPVTEAVILGSVVEFADGSHLVLTSAVSRLTIIADEIRASEVDLITYEDLDRAPATIPLPSPRRAAAGGGSNPNDPTVYSAGGGGDGADGDQGGSGFGGGTGRRGEGAPDVTIHVLSTPGGLPGINLRGRPGGRGQDGQHGGRGEDGARGRSSVSNVCTCGRFAGDGGNGGRGGVGGVGGTGGAGGIGGRLRINTLEENVVPMVTELPMTVTLEGGPGGSGGDGGLAGPGGVAGLGGPGSHQCAPGSSGVMGSPGSPSRAADGVPGPRGPNGTWEVTTITRADWDAAFTLPYIVSLDPWEAAVGDALRISVENVTDEVVVRLAGSTLTPIQLDTIAGEMTIVVPPGANGLASVQLGQLSATSETVWSNIVHLRVLPRITALSHFVAVTDNGVTNETLLPDPRGLPTTGPIATIIELSGSGFAPGAMIRFGGQLYQAESVSPMRFRLPEWEDIDVSPGPTDISVVNADGRESNSVTFDLQMEVEVRVRAWRVVEEGVEATGWSVEQILEIFETSGDTPEDQWSSKGIRLTLDPAIDFAGVSADFVPTWPYGDDEDKADSDAEIRREVGGSPAHFDETAVNVYFVDSVEGSGTSAFAGGVGEHNWIVYGPRPWPINSPQNQAHLMAHELGHVFGLEHHCGESEPCGPEDVGRLMNPIPHGSETTPAEAHLARVTARRYHGG